jgi:hypothetical protein
MLSMIMNLESKNALHYLLKVKCGSKPRGGQVVILPLHRIRAEDRETQTF